MTDAGAVAVDYLATDARRFSSTSITCSRSSGVMRPQVAISFKVLKHPSQKPDFGSTLQTRMQGEVIGVG